MPETYPTAEDKLGFQAKDRRIKNIE